MKISGVTICGNNVNIECDVAEFKELVSVLSTKSSGNGSKAVSKKVVDKPKAKQLKPAKRTVMKAVTKKPALAPAALKSGSSVSSDASIEKKEKATVVEQVKNPVLSKKEASINALKKAVSDSKTKKETPLDSRVRQDIDALQIVRMHDIEGMGFKEIAKKLGCAAQTAYNRYYKVKRV